MGTVMQKNYRCPGCGVTLEFDPATQKLHCAYCEASYSVAEIEKALQALTAKLEQIGINTAEPEKPAEEQKEEKSAEDMYRDMRETMQMTILHCNACGAELAIDGTEASTFCAFCGQAAVVTDRLEGMLKPDYIIPFKVTKEEAEKTIRKRLSKGFFVPKKVKNFETDCLRGIYIPYWLFDVYYGDRQLWRYETDKKTFWGGREKKTAVRGGDCTFRSMTLDASKAVPDESSKRLEPYDLEGMVPFDAAYLSGFYSNKRDYPSYQMEQTAIRRAAELFDEYVENNVKSTLKRKKPEKISCNPIGKAMNPRYVLLPAWFLTFSYDGVPHTMLINGQTGKMIGAVPYVKAKAFTLLAVLAGVFCTALGAVGGIQVPWLFKSVSEIDSDVFEALGNLCIVGGLSVTALWHRTVKNYKRLSKSCKLTESTVTRSFATERQDR